MSCNGNCEALTTKFRQIIAYFRAEKEAKAKQNEILDTKVNLLAQINLSQREEIANLYESHRNLHSQNETLCQQTEIVRRESERLIEEVKKSNDELLSEKKAKEHYKQALEKERKEKNEPESRYLLLPAAVVASGLVGGPISMVVTAIASQAYVLTIYFFRNAKRM